MIRNKQHLARLRTWQGALVLETMYYADEVRLPDESVDRPKPRLEEAEVEMATSLVENLSETFDPEKYNDTYRKELLAADPREGEGEGAARAARSARPRSST